MRTSAAPILLPATPLPAQAFDPALAPVVLGNGPAVLPRDDEVLRSMPVLYRDERTWKQMRRTEPRLSISIRSLNALLLSYGWQLELPEGRSTPAAQVLKATGQALLDQIDGLPAYLESSSLAAYYGWTLHQALWKTFNFRGRKLWAIGRLNEQPQEYFSFTPSDELVLFSPATGRGVVMNAGANANGWVISRAGSTASPYGEALFTELWLLWRLKQRFFEYFSLGVRDAARGILHVKDARVPTAPLMGIGGEIDEGEGKRVFESLSSELRQIFEYYDRDGVLLSRQGLALEFLKNEAFVGTWRQAMDYVDLLLQIAVEGQHLTSQQQDTGSRALGDIHLGTKMAYAQRLARTLEPILRQQVLLRTLEMNEPGGVDLEDLPQFRFNVHYQIEPDKLRLLVDLGARVAAEPVAAEWHVPLAPEGTPAGMVLERRQMPAFLRPQSSAPTPPDGDQATPPQDVPGPRDPGKPSREPARTGARTAAEAEQDAADAQDAGFEAILAPAMKRAEPSFRAYVSRLADAVLKATGDGTDLDPKA